MTAAAIAGGAPTRRRGTVLLLLAAPVTLLVLIVGFPLVDLLRQSVAGPSGWSVYVELARSDVVRAVLGRTLTTAALVSLVCLLLGYPYAYLMTLAGKGLRALLLVLILLPFWTSFTIRTLAWVVLLQDQGLINDALAAVGLPRLPLIRNTTGVVIGMAHVLLPYAVLPLYAVMQRIDRRLVDAASSCGASRRAAWFQVYLPLSLPGVAAAAVLVFILSLGFFITPQLLGSSRNALLSQLIYTNVTRLGDTTTAAALGMVLLGITLVLMIMFGLLARVLSRSGSRIGGVL
ncbi:ABC transporter permease [Microlunatus sp. GCM10028923]|uniref:ABC transporter permease n=1 Tax=Microlunatus sp. GCM10028923 TaxID=3273400 RepID=UPI00360FF12F